MPDRPLHYTIGDVDVWIRQIADEALPLAQRLGNVAPKGRIHHLLADRDFTRGGYASSRAPARARGAEAARERPARAVLAGARAHEPGPRAARARIAGERARRLSRGDGGPDPHRRSARRRPELERDGRRLGEPGEAGEVARVLPPRAGRGAVAGRQERDAVHGGRRRQRAAAISARPSRPSRSTSASCPTTPIRTSRGSGWLGSPRRIWPSDAPRMH